MQKIFKNNCLKDYHIVILSYQKEIFAILQLLISCNNTFGPFGNPMVPGGPGGP